MAKRYRQTTKKRDREAAKRQKQQDKAKRIAARKAGKILDDELKVPNEEEISHQEQ